MTILHVAYPHGLVEAQREACAQIDAAAGAARARYITAVSGQAETYLAKHDDAVAFLADGDLAQHPWVAAEAQATDTPAAQAAATIVATRLAWQSKGVEIEQARMTGKTAVAAAGSARLAFFAASQTVFVLESL